MKTRLRKTTLATLHRLLERAFAPMTIRGNSAKIQAIAAHASVEASWAGDLRERVFDSYADNLHQSLDRLLKTIKVKGDAAKSQVIAAHPSAEARWAGDAWGSIYDIYADDHLLGSGFTEKDAWEEALRYIRGSLF